MGSLAYLTHDVQGHVLRQGPTLQQVFKQLPTWSSQSIESVVA